MMEYKGEGKEGRKNKDEGFARNVVLKNYQHIVAIKVILIANGKN